MFTKPKACWFSLCEMCKVFKQMRGDGYGVRRHGGLVDRYDFLEWSVGHGRSVRSVPLFLIAAFNEIGFRDIMLSRKLAQRHTARLIICSNSCPVRHGF